MKTAMADPLYRLLAWLSPAYPIGAFSYSHGVRDRGGGSFIKDRASLVTWLESVLLLGTGVVDGALFAAAWRAAEAEGLDVVRRHRRARRRLARHLGDGAGIAPAGRLVPVDHPHGLAASQPRCRARAAGGRAVAAGRCGAGGRGARHRARPRPRGLPACLHRQPDLAAVRSVPLGQSDGQIALAALEPAVRQATGAALAVTSLDEVGTATPLLDWCSLSHETQYTRLFRS